MPPGPLGQRPQRQRPDRHTDQPRHLEPDPREHPPDLPVLPLVEHHLEPERTPRAHAQHGDAHGRELVAGRGIGHALAEAREESLIRQALHLHVVHLLDGRCGIGDAGAPLGIIREEQEPFARLVESPHRADEGQVRAGETFVDRGASLGVVARGDEPARLVERQVDLRGGADGSAVHLDARALRIQAERELLHHLALHPHASGAHEALALRARAEAKLGKCARDAHGPVAPLRVAHVDSAPRVALRRRDPRRAASRPRPVEVVAADRAEGVEHLAGEEETGMRATLHRARVDRRETHSAPGDLGLLVALVPVPGERAAHEGLDQSEPLFAAQLGERPRRIDLRDLEQHGGSLWGRNGLVIIW